MTQSSLRRPFAVATLAAVLDATLVLLAAGTAVANVYATNLKIGGGTDGAINVAGGGTVALSFVLNENADTGVTLTIYRASDNAAIRTVNLGPLPRGTNSWNWDGRNDGGALVSAGSSYYFKVTASDDGHAAWEAISDDANPQNKYYLPTSVEVNRDPNSKYYGRVYVGEGQGSGNDIGFTGFPKVTTSGFYLLNADCSDAVGQGDTARTAGVDWDFGAPLATATGMYDTLTSPWHTHVAPDGRLFCGGYWDGLSGCYALDPDATLSQTVLSPAAWSGSGTAPSGLTDNHGNQTSLWIEGVGDQMKMFYLDEDYERTTLPNGNVYQFNIGSETWPIQSKPTRYIVQFTVGTHIYNDITQLRRDGEGNWYMSQYRWGGTDAPSVVKVSADGKTLLWDSLAATRAHLGDPAAADMLRMAQSLAVDGVRNRLAVATRNAGALYVLGTDMNLTNLTTITVSGSLNRDCTFDNVGNLYVVNSSAEILRVYSPPDGANSSTTKSYGKIVATSGDVTPPSAPTVTDDGVRQIGTTQTHASWSGAADMESGIASYECAVSYTPYDLGTYVKGWTNVGNVTQATITGLNLQSGKTYYVLVRAVNGAGLAGPAGISDGILVIAPTTVGGAKKFVDGAIVAIQDAVVTKKFTSANGDFFYIEDIGRAAGIRCVGNVSVTEGHVVQILGTVRVAEEMYIQVENADDQGLSPEPIKPVGMLLKNLGGGANGKQAAVAGGTGTNTVGLYVKVWGNVEFQNFDNDGLRYYPVSDGSVAMPISCYSEDVMAPEWAFDKIEGICSVKNGKPIILMTAAE